MSSFFFLQKEADAVRSSFDFIGDDDEETEPLSAAHGSPTMPGFKFPPILVS